jgi:diacylglycerol kinase (ATP)
MISPTRNSGSKNTPGGFSPDEILVVFNPAARVGRLAKSELDVRAGVKKALGRVAFVLTTHKGHARELVADLPPTIKLVVVIGGDGSVHDVACGLAESGSNAAMAVIPMGSGNDFARALKMPMNWVDALGQLRTAVPRSVDVGGVGWKEDGEEFQDWFINALGIGLDAHCAYLAPQYKGWPFGLGYTASILAGLKSWVSGGATIWDTSNEKQLLFSGRMLFTTIGNAQDSGGGYKINPKALVTDGLLDACIVKDMTFFQALRLLPSARDGGHLKNKAVSYFQLTDMLIETDRGLPVHADGEVKSLQARSIRVSVHPGKLTVFVPSTAPEKL